MKIFIEADSIATEKMSGIGHATLEIIRVLDKLCGQRNDLRVTAIVPSTQKKQVKEKYGFSNIRIKSLPPPYRYVNYALTRTSLPFFADLWYGRGYYIFPNYKNWHVPFSKSLTFVHDLAFKNYPETINEKNLVYLEANMTRWLKRADFILNISKATNDEFKKYFPEFASKARIVYLGVDTETYRRKKKTEIDEVIKKHNLPHKYFLFVGNLEPRKNVLRLLEAYKFYADKSKKPQALVLIGGDGWKNEDIKLELKTMQNGGYLIFHPKGYIEDIDMPAIYSGSTALIHIAKDEGFGLTILEAKATNIPAIVSDISVMKEVAGPSDYIVDPDNVQSVSDTMVLLSRQPTSPTHDMEKKDIEILQKYTWENTVDQIIDVIQKDK